MQVASTINITIPVVNKGSTEKPYVLPKGTLLSVNQPGMQNVIVAEEVSVVLAPGERREVMVLGYCLNSDLQWPKGATGEMTKYSLGKPFANQHDVWATLSIPDIGEAIKFKELKLEMLQRIRTHNKLRIISGDVGFLYDDLSGETISEKCYFLIEACRVHDRIDLLIETLREEFPLAVLFSNWGVASVV
jgi:hypothetical protein